MINLRRKGYGANPTGHDDGAKRQGALAGLAGLSGARVGAEGRVPARLGKLYWVGNEFAGCWRGRLAEDVTR